MESPLDKAVKAAGTQLRLAELLGIQYQSIQSWDPYKIPANRIVDIEKATGIPRSELRPDLYA